MTANTKLAIRYTIAGVVILATLCFLFPIEQYFFKSLRFYANHWLAACLFIGIVGLFMKDHLFLYTGFICAGALSFYLMKSFNDNLRLPEVNKQKAFSIVLTNAALISDAPEEYLLKIIDESADVILFEEFTPDWHKITNRLFRNNYPYIVRNARIDPLGKAIFSKWPIYRYDRLEEAGNPYLMTCLQVRSDTIWFLQSSFLPPVTLRNYERLGVFLDSLRIRIRSLNGEHLINSINYHIAPWSTELLNFKQSATLQTSRRDNMASGTSNFLHVPFFDVLFSEKLECSQFNTLQDESNHTYGILGQYQLIE